MNDKHAAKYTFLYLLSLIALIFLGISIGIVIFDIINQLVFDPLSSRYYNNTEALKFAISAIFISAPVYFLSLRQITKGLRKKELTLSSPIRKWLSYLIILISAVIILGVFVAILQSFLLGDLSLKFALKSITVFLISSLVFSYYFYDIKKESENKKDLKNNVFFVLAVILVLGTFISSWFFVESPRESRMRKIDNLTLDNINSLQSLVNDYYFENEKLPESIDNLKDLNYFNESIFFNPELNEEIELKIVSDSSFELCTHFNLSSDRDIKGNIIDSRNMYNSRMKHQAGYNCVKGELYIKDEVLNKAKAI